ncbi:MAG: hypothetical protein GC186_19220 [Rhodobacteraceae bacterium]|nr:hypothetical protein [Paracoccaceae bacterium]
MADFGPSYEQTLQNIGMEMLRVMLLEPFDFCEYSKKKRDWAKFALWKAYTERILADAGVKELVAYFQPDDLQVHASMNVAGMFAQHGYQVAMSKVPEDRYILMSRLGVEHAARNA